MDVVVLLATVLLPLGAAAGWRWHRKALALDRADLEVAVRRWVFAADPSATLRLEDDGRIAARLTLDARPCDLAVDPDRAGQAWALLRVALPVTVLGALLREDRSAGKVRTGDLGFNDRFAVTARSEGAARLLSERVRAAMVQLPRAMEAPKLVVDREGLELSWSGPVTPQLLGEASRVLLALRAEIDARLPLR